MKTFIKFLIAFVILLILILFLINEQKKPYNPVTYTDADIIKLKEWIKVEETKAIGDIKLGMTINEFNSKTKENLPHHLMDHDSKEIYVWYNVEYKFDLSEDFAVNIEYVKFYKDSLYDVDCEIYKKAIYVDSDSQRWNRDKSYEFLRKIFNAKYRQQLIDLNFSSVLIRGYIVHEPSSYNKYDDYSYGDKWSIGNKRIRTYVVNDHGQDHDFNKIKINIYNQETENKINRLVSNKKDKEALDSVNKF